MNARSGLETLAREAKTSVKSQVCTIANIRYDSYVRIRRGGRTMTVRATEDRVGIGTPVSSSIVFAAGHPGLMTRRRLPDTDGTPLFSADSDRSDPRPWLADAGHRRLVDALPLDGARQLEVVRNVLHWHGMAEDLDTEPSVLDQLVLLADALPKDGDGQPVVSGTLPADLEILRKLIPKWALSDDEARTDRIARASDSSLLALWTSASPRLSAIDLFIEDAEPSSLELAASLGDLAQAALEARTELESRGVALGA